MLRKMFSSFADRAISVLVPQTDPPGTQISGVNVEVSVSPIFLTGIFDTFCCTETNLTKEQAVGGRPPRYAAAPVRRTLRPSSCPHTPYAWPAAPNAPWF